MDGTNVRAVAGNDLSNRKTLGTACVSVLRTAKHGEIRKFSQEKILGAILTHYGIKGTPWDEIFSMLSILKI